MPRIDRWQKDPADFDGIRTGDVVKVQMGAGTERGKVVSRSKDRVNVSLGKRTISVWDARSIIRA
jgi:sRNA-binding protein